MHNSLLIYSEHCKNEENLLFINSMYLKSIDFNCIDLVEYKIIFFNLIYTYFVMRLTIFRIILNDHNNHLK